MSGGLVTSKIIDFSSKALWSFLPVHLYSFSSTSLLQEYYLDLGEGGELKRNTLPQTGCQEWKESYIPGTSLSSYF